jgi:DNA-binding MarR family transcriptional regulator
MSIDYALMLTAVLLLLTIVTTLLYYRRIRLASIAYEEAKDVVADIVISFDKQLQRQEQQIGTSIQKIETATAKSERLSKQIEEQESSFNARLEDLASKVNSKTEAVPDQEPLRKEIESLKVQLESLVKAQEELKEHEVVASDSPIGTPIPIKRERALAPLTETELRVLEFIAGEGEKTAPEIKDFIKLTREHSARLMKKLYQEGYVERRSDKTPYAYVVKEEMLKILKKGEVKA